MAVKNGSRSFLSVEALTAKCDRSYPSSRMRALSHLLLLQHRLLIETNKEGIKPMELASCANAWGNLDKQRVFLIGQGWLYHLRDKPKKDNRGALNASAWEEPKQVQDAVVVVDKPAEVSKDVPPTTETAPHKTPESDKPQ